MAISIGRKQTLSVCPQIHYKLTFYYNTNSDDDDDYISGHTILLQHTCLLPLHSILFFVLGPFSKHPILTTCCVLGPLQSPTPTITSITSTLNQLFQIHPHICWGPPMPIFRRLFSHTVVYGGPFQSHLIPTTLTICPYHDGDDFFLQT